MKASKLIKALQETIEEHGDLELVYSIDEEGNSFHKVYFTPTIGNFSNFDFITKENIDDDYFDDQEDYPINAICIN